MKGLVLGVLLILAAASFAAAGQAGKGGNHFSGLSCDSTNQARKGTNAFTVEIKMFQGDIIMKGKSGKRAFYEGPVTEIGETYYFIENNIGGLHYTLDYWPDPDTDRRVRAAFTTEHKNGTFVAKEDMICR